jgi:hypothetical protein
MAKIRHLTDYNAEVLSILPQPDSNQLFILTCESVMSKIMLTELSITIILYLYWIITEMFLSTKN